MNTMYVRKLPVILILAFALALPALAQSASEVEFVGTIQSVTATTITINGQVIDISGAEIQVPLTAGTAVKIEGTLGADGSVVAREVQGADDGIQPGEAELVGTVQSITADTIVVNGQTVNITNAELAGRLAVGSLVNVHATADASGTWVARQVEPADAEDNGDDDLIGDNSNDLDDDNDDDLIGDNDNELDADNDDDLIGDNDNDLDEVDDNGDELEFTGTLESVGDGFIVVSGQTISTVGAEIKDPLVVGALVKVHAQPGTTGLVAREVENEVAEVGDDNGGNNDDLGIIDGNDDNPIITVPTTVTAQDAINTAQAAFPGATIVEVELKSAFGGTLVWEVKTSSGQELLIDAEAGTILSVEQSGGNDDNSGPGSSNSGPGSSNSGPGSGDDLGNDDSGDDDIGDDDSSGRGSDDVGDDNSSPDSDDSDGDNSGSGSDDDSDDGNSGSGSDDDSDDSDDDGGDDDNSGSGSRSDDSGGDDGGDDDNSGMG